MQRSSDIDTDAKKYFYPKSLNRRITDDQRRSLENMPKERFGEWDVKNGKSEVHLYIYLMLLLKALINKYFKKYFESIYFLQNTLLLLTKDGTKWKVRSEKIHGIDFFNVHVAQSPKVQSNVNVDDINLQTVSLSHKCTLMQMNVFIEFKDILCIVTSVLGLYLNSQKMSKDVKVFVHF
jgi:hypothetical protein